MDLLINVALQHLNIPYIWGGKCPLVGLDCSGLVQVILRAAGIDPPLDQNSQAYYNHFVSLPGTKAGEYGPGALVFYGKNVRSITHIAWCLSEHQMIEAGGGDSTTRTLQDAKIKDAYVKVMPIQRRKDLVAVLMPEYPFSQSQRSLG